MDVWTGTEGALRTCYLPAHAQHMSCTHTAHTRVQELTFQFVCSSVTPVKGLHGSRFPEMHVTCHLRLHVSGAPVMHVTHLPLSRCDGGHLPCTYMCPSQVLHVCCPTCMLCVFHVPLPCMRHVSPQCLGTPATCYMCLLRAYIMCAPVVRRVPNHASHDCHVFPVALVCMLHVHSHRCLVPHHMCCVPCPVLPCVACPHVCHVCCARVPVTCHQRPRAHTAPAQKLNKRDPCGCRATVTPKLR